MSAECGFRSAESDARSGSARVIVCFAFEEEAGAFRRIAAGKADVLVLITGVGQKNAEKAVRDCLKTFSPQWVLTSGFAGGLNPALATGDVIVSTENAALCEKLRAAGAKPSKIFCVSRIATTVTEKQELRRTTGADAVEMESESIHAVCRECGIPCVTVRVISDAADENLPLDFNQLAKPDLSLDYGKLAWAVARSPGKISALLRLQKTCRFAARQLAETLAKVIWPP
jgi:adenosylhomocysteine nucleosidase